MAATRSADNTSDDGARTNRGQTPEQALAACKHYWEVSGVSPADIDDMLAELRTHLDAAVASGRRVDDVVGADVAGFAGAWAQARVPRRQRWARLAADAAGALTLVALFGHLVRRTTELPVGLGHLLWPVTMLIVLIAWRSARGAPRFPKVFLVSALIAVPLTVAFDALFGVRVLFRLPLWVTASLGILVAARLWWDARRRAADRRSTNQ